MTIYFAKRRGGDAKFNILISFFEKGKGGDRANRIYKVANVCHYQPFYQSKK